MTVLVVISPIAGGKSSLIKILEDKLGVITIDESLDRITNIEGENQLERFYKDMKRWSLTTEILFFTTRANKVCEYVEKNGKDRVYVMERDCFSGRKCFAEMLLEDENMSKMEWEIYNSIFSTTESEKFPKPNGYVYIRCPIDSLMERVRVRGRKEEIDIELLEYQKKLISKHEEFLSILMKNEIPYIVINGKIDFRNSGDIQDQIVEEISSFIKRVR